MRVLPIPAGSWSVVLGALAPGLLGLACDGAAPSQPTDPDFAVPAPLRPWNGETTGSVHAERALRPRFQWTPVPGAASYDLQVDDGCAPTAFASCAFPSPEIDARAVTGPSYTPARALPVSRARPVGRRYFWRVRACAENGCSPWSAVRYVDVGRMAQDLDGDGYADLVVGADPGPAGPGRVYVYFGGPRPLPATPDLTLTGSAAGDGFGYAVEPAGDLDGDGYGDLVVGAFGDPQAGPGAGRTFVYRGGPALDPTPVLALAGAAGEQHGVAVSGAGDVNGDGYADFVVGAAGAGAGAGRAELHLGGPVLRAAPDLALAGEGAGSFFGFPVEGAGDVNGDGYADLLVGATLTANGTAYVYLGGAVPDARADSIIQGAAAGDAFGGASSSAGDVDGDGLADLALSAYLSDAGGADAGSVYVYRGGATPALVFEAAGPAPGAQISAVTLVDLDGDGLDDVVAAFGGVAGRHAFIYRGTAVAPRAAPDIALAGSDRSFSIGCAGDLDGDGYDDLVIGAPGADASGGHVYIHLGGPAPSSAPDVILEAPNPSDGFGAVAS